MKKIFLLSALAMLSITGVVAQQATNDGNVQSFAPPTTPTGLGQFEVQGKLFSHNSLTPTTTTQYTGSFDPAAQWSSLGRIDGGSQTLYGQRYQRAGRALALGFTGALQTGAVPTLGNAFIYWGGNSASSVAPGDLAFKVFTSPTMPMTTQDVLTLKENTSAVFGTDPGVPPTSQVQINSKFDNSLDIFKDNSSVSGSNAGGISMLIRSDLSAVGIALKANTLSTASGSTAVGISSTAIGGQNSQGVYGVGGNATTTNIGIYGDVDASSSGTKYAGYFNGRVFSTVGFTVSDQKFKTDIKLQSKALESVMQLRPISYLYDTKKFSYMNLEDNLQHGFVAQELEKIFPEMVTTNDIPMMNHDEKTGKATLSKMEHFKAVNYVALIPILTKAIQEQQQQIEELKTQLADEAGAVTVIAEDAADAKVKANSFMLAQNVPNPFTASTTIKYSIPEKNNAMIAVMDLNGKMLLQFNNLKGASQITINGNTLQAGMYLYTLVVNGQEIITKKMVLTK